MRTKKVNEILPHQHHHHRSSLKPKAVRERWNSGKKSVLNHIVSCYTNVTNNWSRCDGSVTQNCLGRSAIFISLINHLIEKQFPARVDCAGSKRALQACLDARLLFLPLTLTLAWTTFRIHSDDIELFIEIRRKNFMFSPREEATGWRMSRILNFIPFLVINHSSSPLPAWVPRPDYHKKKIFTVLFYGGAGWEMN